MAGHNKKPDPPSPASVPALQSFRVSHSQRTTRLHYLLVVLFTLTALLGAYFSYRPVRKTRNNKWWTFETRRSTMPHPLPLEHVSAFQNSIEGRINDLAKVLGIPPQELASAVAVAVKNHVPSQSVSSLASKDASSTIVPSRH